MSSESELLRLLLFSFQVIKTIVILKENLLRTNLVAFIVHAAVHRQKKLSQ